MTKTIRERIESYDPEDAGLALCIHRACIDGQLMPTDEADAAIAAAERKGMERAARICDRRSVMVEARGCAIAIRAAMEDEDNHAN